MIPKSTTENVTKQLAMLTDDPLLKLSSALPLWGGVYRGTAIKWHKAGKLKLVKVGRFYKVRASEVLRVARGRIEECLASAASAVTHNSVR